jgi:hypothetical protein
MKNKRRYSKKLRDNTILIFVILLLIALIIVFIKFYMGHYTTRDLLNDLFNSLIGVIVPLILFNVIYEYLIRSHQDEVIAESIVESMLLDKDILDRFDHTIKKSFIKNSTQSIKGVEVGEMLYSTLFLPYLIEENTSFRTNFKYYIFYLESNPNEQLDSQSINFNHDDYCWVSEDLSYEKSLVIPNEGLSVGFSYNELKLDSYFRNEKMVFRENLWLHDDEIAVINELNDEELKKLIEHTLQFKLEVNGFNFLCHKILQDNGNGFIINFIPPANFIFNENSRIRFNFIMPQLRKKKQFIVFISEPTNKVDILFSNKIKDMKVSTIPFFDQDEIISSLPNDIIKIELNDWILPTSGVVFVWS